MWHASSPLCRLYFYVSIAVCQVTPEQRSHAKRLAYGLLYGMGPSALAADLGVSVGQAVQLADDFRRSHPGLDAWIKVCWLAVQFVTIQNAWIRCVVSRVGIWLGA
jgi:hypothetical protein